MHISAEKCTKMENIPYLVILKNYKNMILDADPESRIRMSPELQSTVPCPKAYCPKYFMNIHPQLFE